MNGNNAQEKPSQPYLTQEYNISEEMTTKHRELVRRVICGQTARQISEETGMHYNAVICITNSPLFKQEKERMLKTIESNVVNTLSDPKAYLNRRAIDAAKKLTTLMENSESENIQLASANSILDRAGAPKITKTEGEQQLSLHIDGKVMKLLLVSKLEAGLIPDEQRQETLEQIAELESSIIDVSEDE